MFAWNIFEIVINFFQAFLHLFFLKSRVHIARKGRLPDIIVVAVYTLFLTVYLFYPLPVPDSIGSVIFFVYLLALAEDPWFISFLWCAFYEAVAIGTISVFIQAITSVLQIPYDLLMEPGYSRFMFVMTVNFALFLVFFSLSRIRKDSSSLDWSVLLLFLGINIMALLAIESLFSFQVQYAFDNRLLFLPFLALSLISVFSILLFYTVTSLTQRKHHAEVALNHATLTKDYQQSLKELYTDMSARQHDFKHQVETIRQLVQNGDMDAAKEYFAAYEKKADISTAAFITGNLAMDALLTAKSITCAKNSIQFKFVHYPLNDLPISEVDLCAIVGNLLDNAIEAVNRIIDPNEQKWISLSFARVWDMFYITCENSMRPSTIRKRYGKFLTSKVEKPTIHGFGIPNIISTVTAYDGECSFDVKDQTFIASITLPYQAHETADQ